MSLPLFSLQRSRNYFYGLLILLIGGLIMLLWLGKSGSFIALNPFHPEWLNTFFTYYTYTGDGFFALILSLVLILYVKTRREGIALLMAFLLSGLVVQVIKNLVDSPRPGMFFEPGQYHHFINGVTLSNNAGFPSGHTASAFALATVLALFLKNINWQLPVLLFAAFTGYSRIYLGQHFLGDVLVGTLIGCLSGLLACYLVVRFQFTRKGFRKAPHFDNELLPPDTVAIQAI